MSERRFTSPAKSGIIISAKAGHFSVVWTDFLFYPTCYKIPLRPSVVTAGSAFASDLSSDTGGRTILNPRHFRPPKISKQKSRQRFGAATFNDVGKSAHDLDDTTP